LHARTRAVSGPNTGSSTLHNAFNMDDRRPANIPPELKDLIQANVAFQVFICPHDKCRKAVQPCAFSEHLRVLHETPLRDRRRVQAFLSTFDWQYDFATIRLPRDGSRPQSTIPVIDGFQCRMCPSNISSRPFKSISEKRMRVHGNKEHKKQRVGDDELFWKVRLQSWFQDHRQRYWVVDESKRGDRPREEEGQTSELGLDEDSGIVNPSSNRESSCVAEAREEVITEGGRDDEVAELGVDDDEWLSDLEDSGDEDYRGSSEDIGSDGDGRGLSVVDRSDDEDYEESSGVNDSDGLSTVEGVGSDDGDRSSGCTDDDEEADVIVVGPVYAMDSNPSGESRVRKRRMECGYKGRKMLDSDGSMYRDSSPGNRGVWGRQQRKRQRMMTRFEDSGVAMGSSQDDGVVRPSSHGDDTVPPSSPPDFGWMIGRGQRSIDDRPSLPGTPSTIIAQEDNGDDGDNAPFGHQFQDQHRGTAQSRLEQFRERLDRWCRTCPACYLAGDFGGKAHRMTDCWRDSRHEIIDQVVVMQRHMDKGFEGKGGCSSCGVPRAICERWQVKADGVWEEVPGQQCQYMLILVPAVITMMVDGSNEGWAVVGSWMDRAGVMRTSQVEVFEWFRRAIWWEELEVEVAQITRVFHMLVNKNRGLGRA